MLYITISLIFLIFPSLAAANAIVLVWGVPEGQPTSNGYHNIWTECSTLCLNNVQCVLIQKAADGCHLYHLGSVKTVIKTDRASGQIVGFKRTMNNCPNSSDAPMFDETSVQETFVYNENNYKYNITKTVTNKATIWSFRFSNTIQCPPDSFLSVRKIYQVCISVQLFTGPEFCRSQSYGVKLCQSIGGIGLTGPFSSTEGGNITDIAATKSKEIPSGQKGYQHFWIDGKQKGQPGVTLSDSTLNIGEGYNWTWVHNDTEELCVYLGTESGVSGKATPYDCHIEFTPEFCMRGAVCRTRPVTYY